MKRLNERTVHLEDEELLAYEQFQEFLDEGRGIAHARTLVRHSRAVKGLPDLSDEFWMWLS